MISSKNRYFLTKRKFGVLALYYDLFYIQMKIGYIIHAMKVFIRQLVITRAFLKDDSGGITPTENKTYF